MSDKRKYFPVAGIYKGQGAIEYSIVSMADEKEKSINVSYRVKLKLAKSLAARKYDWANAILIYLGMSDILEILGAIRKNFATWADDQGKTHSSVELFHDPKKGTPEEGKTTKALTFNVPKDVHNRKGAAVVFMDARQAENKVEKTKVSIGLSAEDIIRLRIDLEYAVPILDGFHNVNLNPEPA